MCVGPDLVSAEFLLALSQAPGGLQALTAMFQEVYDSARLPSDWSISVLALFPNQVQPTTPSQLRPIALSSHTGKVFSRIMLARVGGCLEATGPQQMATRGRQSADMVWVAKHLFSLSREWRVPAIAVKLDIRRAFDSVILSWVAADFPREAACFVAMLELNQLLLMLPWDEEVVIRSGVGVRQGSTESPCFFSKLMDDILAEVCGRQNTFLLEGMSDCAVAFMDDVLGWFPNAQSVRAFFQDLVPLLRSFGLSLQPSKCQLALLGGAADPGVLIDGVPLTPLAPDEPLYVMHVPVHTQLNDVDLIIYMIDKAKGTFYSLLPVLTSKASLHWRLRLLDKTVLSAMQWVLGVVYPGPKVQTLLNHFQYRCVRTLLGCNRRANELWLDYELRTIRLSRLMVWRHLGRRCGDFALQLHWTYIGHRIRQRGVVLAHFRGLDWWLRRRWLAGATTFLIS